MWWACLLSAFMGGVLALAALIMALALAFRGGHPMSLHFGGQGVTFYKEMELMEFAVRPGGVYVKYRNTGDKHATTACFRVRVFNKDGQLIAETEEAACNETAPGEVEESVLATHDFEDDWIHDPQNRIDVAFRYGYLE